MLLSIVIPCHNEETVIPLFFQEIELIRKKMPIEFEYIFINDGSTDQTLATLKNLYENNRERVHFLSFSKNFGKEAALYAGLQHAKGEYVTVMDADLQDPPELLLDMYEKIQAPDIDCVGTRRITRDGEPVLRSFFAKLFYKIINKIGQTEMVDGARDFRLMTRQMVNSILEVKEYNRFSKGIFTWVGYNTIYLEYENRERIAGETSWSFFQLLTYSLDGIINFSDSLLNIASYVGAASCIGSIIAMIFIVVRTLLYHDPTSGWPSLVCIILFIGGLQLLCLGIIGKYIGKIFLETKKRPSFIIKEDENGLVR